MEQILAGIFSEKGMVYGLFAISFLLFVAKGLPFLINKIFTQQAALQEAQHALYKTELGNITQAFIKSITDSNAWHQTHSAELQEIKGIIDKRFQSRSR